jgi:hypothetical protein
MVATLHARCNCSRTMYTRGCCLTTTRGKTAAPSSSVVTAPNFSPVIPGGLAWLESVGLELVLALANWRTYTKSCKGRILCYLLDGTGGSTSIASHGGRRTRPPASTALHPSCHGIAATRRPNEIIKKLLASAAVHTQTVICLS